MTVVVVNTTQLQQWGGLLSHEIVDIAMRVGEAVEDEQEKLVAEGKSNVGVRKGWLRDDIRGTGRSPIRRRVVAGKKRTFYGLFHYYGTVHHAANPFMLKDQQAELAEFEQMVQIAVLKGQIYR